MLAPVEPSQNPGPRSLLDWLADRFPDTPRKRLKGWFADGRVRLDGATARRFHETMADPGERLEFVAREAGTGRVESDLRLHQSARLVFLDGSLAIVNKSPGLLSVPFAGRDEPSALDFLRKHLERTGAPGVEALPVHRLDEYTSGLMCFALTADARESLIEQLRAHAVERTYLAFVDGQPEAPRGTWRHLCKLDEDGYRQRIVPEDTPDATEALTDYETLATYRHDAGPDRPERVVSKLRITLRTGLKHQIRLQAAASGTPLVGDRTYHPDLRGDKRRGKHTVRQALHAVRLGLAHPVSGEPMVWEAPLPQDLSRFEADLRKQSRARHRPPRER